jgi:hypothetical protein
MKTIRVTIDLSEHLYSELIGLTMKTKLNKAASLRKAMRIYNELLIAKNAGCKILIVKNNDEKELIFI